MLNIKTILITSGTGSLGKAIMRYMFDKYPKIQKIVIFLRVDEEIM